MRKFHCISFCLLFASVACLAGAERASDEILELPGWSGKLPTRQFSGYVDLDSAGERRMHYWLVESASQPESDPLVLWVQGGPGCSSLLGYFTEVGPFQVKPGSGAGETVLVENEYAWNKLANVLYWESPVGVGYSYTAKKDDYRTNDTRTAEDNLQFVLNFLKLYPEYRNRDFYITGESYAGIYIPMLAHLILDYNSKATAEEQIHLKGLMVGNGCTGNKVGACGDAYDLTIALPFFYAHGLYSMATREKLSAACTGQAVPTTPACARAVNETYAEIGLINMYDIYGTCLPANSSEKFNVGLASRSPRRRQATSLPISGLPECAIGPEAQIYMRREDVARAIHVSLEAAPAPWTACSDFLHAQYGETVADLLPTYPEILHEYRTLIYNGDADGRIPYTDNEAWTAGMKFSVVKPWHAWMVDGQVAGYVVDYESEFSFATIKGSGHMVPQFKPKQAFAMFERFINHLPL